MSDKPNPAGTAALLRELAHVKATFQLRAVCAAIGVPPPPPEPLKP